jgi:molybdenum cofactor sulfurtransferase
MKLFGRPLGRIQQKSPQEAVSAPASSASRTLDSDFEAFLRKWPAFASTSHLDELRATDYARLDKQGHIYLDYTGGGLYAERQLQAHFDLLRESVLGNPHSDNPTSQAMTELAEHARAYVLDYFHASPEEYLVAFTSNASGALKLVGESYPFTPESHFLITYDNHNSVNGIREFAHARGAHVRYVPVVPPELRLDEALLAHALEQSSPGSARLFAYPAQSNFSGVQYSLEWIERAQASGWDVLLDAAAFVPSNSLDLSQWHPDFVPVSFYKIFGYPTGVGCLLARKGTVKKLHRPWFSGGTIWAVSVGGEQLIMLENEAAFEDGTINYLNLPAIEIGLKYIQSIGIETIHTRVMCLTGWLLDRMATLHHPNGAPLIQVYGPWDIHMRGGTIAFNFLDPNGSIVDERLVGRRANQRRISLRTGCFCNPGAGEVAFSVPPTTAQHFFHADERPQFDDFLAAMGMRSGGAVRVSLGLATTFADVSRFAEFCGTFLDDYAGEDDLPPRLHC